MPQEYSNTEDRNNHERQWFTSPGVVIAVLVILVVVSYMIFILDSDREEEGMSLDSEKEQILVALQAGEGKTVSENEKADILSSLRQQNELPVSDEERQQVLNSLINI